MESKTKVEGEKTYYYLPLDSYNQPDGNVLPILLTDEEYLKHKETYVYIYDDYAAALCRALD